VNSSSISIKYQSFFFKHSRFNLFLKAKNIKELVDLLDNNTIPREFNRLELEDIIFDLFNQYKSYRRQSRRGTRKTPIGY